MRWLEPIAAGDAGGPEPALDDPASPPIILLHGIPTSAELWRDVLPRLAGRQALAWELVGYGGSIPSGRGLELSLARQAAYLESWLEARSIRRPVLVGHDLGGGVAQIAAARRPERYAGLLLTNAVAFDGWPVWPVRLLAAAGGAFRQVPAPLWRRSFQRVLAAMHGDGRIGWESARVHWAHYGRRGGARALVRQARWLRAADTLAVADRLPTLRLPARVVWGDADPFLSMGQAARLARTLGTHVHALPGVGHFTPEDAPDALARAILELADAAGAGGRGGPRPGGAGRGRARSRREGG